MTDKSVKESFMCASASPELTAEIYEREQKIDELQENITDYLVQLTQRKLSENQSEIIPHLIHCINDAERIGDYAEKILEYSRRLESSKNKLGEDEYYAVRDLWLLLDSQAKHIISALKDTDKKDVNLALKDEECIDKMADQIEKNYLSKLKKGKCKVNTGMVFLDFVEDAENIGDLLTSIAKKLPEIQKHHLKL